MTEKYDNSHTTEYTSLVATTAGGGHRKLQSEDVMIVPILLRLTEIGNKALMGVGWWWWSHAWLPPHPHPGHKYRQSTINNNKRNPDKRNRVEEGQLTNIGNLVLSPQKHRERELFLEKQNDVKGRGRGRRGE